MCNESDSEDDSLPLKMPEYRKKVRVSEKPRNGQQQQHRNTLIRYIHILLYNSINFFRFFLEIIFNITFFQLDNDNTTQNRLQDVDNTARFFGSSSSFSSSSLSFNCKSEIKKLRRDVKQLIARSPFMDTKIRIRIFKRPWLLCLMAGCRVEDASELCLELQYYYLKLLDMPNVTDDFDDYERDDSNNYLIPIQYKIILKKNQSFLRILSTGLKKYIFQEYTPSFIYNLHWMKDTEELLYKHKVRDLDSLIGIKGDWHSIELLRLVQFACLAFREVEQIFKSSFAHRVCQLRIICRNLKKIQRAMQIDLPRLISTSIDLANRLFGKVPPKIRDIGENLFAKKYKHYMKLKEDGKMREDLRHRASVNKQAFNIEMEIKPYYARRRILREKEELKKLREARNNAKEQKKG